jgi:hypothetical protein
MRKQLVPGMTTVQYGSVLSLKFSDGLAHLSLVIPRCSCNICISSGGVVQWFFMPQWQLDA